MTKYNVFVKWASGRSMTFHNISESNEIKTEEAILIFECEDDVISIPMDNIEYFKVSKEDEEE